MKTLNIRNNSNTNGNPSSGRFLIEWSEQEKRYNIFADSGERVGSDTDAQCAEIKVGLMGFSPQSIVPPNSFEAETIRAKAETFGASAA